ncbi:putative endonuclease [Algoriphagus boseongensis]|uniref:Putative endonuclease n=1 Tax=Algoriphagus boseongensis TaxID=1442587 RepID=A0A4R6T528_9BACT|nr:GIY-YIG nuclease family protein [Algoriphagus boseongensis]TDQ17088.1 putative endonuclease [Algoriphagus boseongensis]TDQ17089.1 putative endonuclease [Algoriphagus boseongensis]
MFTVYAISSKTRRYIYVGLTSDLEERLHRHNSGYEQTTKPYRPFEIIFQRNFPTRVEAREFEKYLKTTRWKREVLGI